MDREQKTIIIRRALMELNIEYHLRSLEEPSTRYHVRQIREKVSEVVAYLNSLKEIEELEQQILDLQRDNRQLTGDKRELEEKIAALSHDIAQEEEDA